MVKVPAMTTDTHQFVLNVAVERVAKFGDECLEPQGVRVADHHLRHNTQTAVPL